MVNIQHVTLNETAQLAKMCVGIGTKGGPAQKGHNLMDSNELAVQQSIATSWISLRLSDGKEIDMSTVSQQILKKRRLLYEMELDLVN